ncbi:hypothetical protein [Sphingomonas sp. DC2300-3]|uniref:hypothetical protein n=2 Tax=unclassified Sphingomonas TaxID=196159 RepID=UPI003CF4D348
MFKTAIKRVCKTCNNEWMGRYEEQVRGVITAMMIGPAVALGFETRELIKQYITFKLMVLDWSSGEPFFSQDERTLFYQRRICPETLQFVLACCPDPSMHTFYHTHFMEAAETNLIDMHDGKRNLKTIAFSYGQIFIIALCRRGAASGVSLDTKAGWIGLDVKPSLILNWPPYYKISAAVARSASETLQAMKSHSDVRIADDLDIARAEIKERDALKRE